MNRAQRKHPNMKLGLIVITMRQHGPHIAKILARQALAEAQHLHERTGVVGFDIAGPERGNPPRLFRSAYEIARLGRLGLTAHAGEDAPPEFVWQAVDELGVDRVGHGCSAVRDPELLKRLARDKIAVEVCLSSNYHTGAVRRGTRHPLHAFLEAGVPVALCSDNSTVSKHGRASGVAAGGGPGRGRCRRDDPPHGRLLFLHPPGIGAARPSGARTLDLTRKRTGTALLAMPADALPGTSPCVSACARAGTGLAIYRVGSRGRGRPPPGGAHGVGLEGALLRGADHLGWAGR